MSGPFFSRCSPKVSPACYSLPQPVTGSNLSTQGIILITEHACDAIALTVETLAVAHRLDTA
jgi:hypothetical protein